MHEGGELSTSNARAGGQGGKPPTLRHMGLTKVCELAREAPWVADGALEQHVGRLDVAVHLTGGLRWDGGQVGRDGLTRVRAQRRGDWPP